MKRYILLSIVLILIGCVSKPIKTASPTLTPLLSPTSVTTFATPAIEVVTPIPNETMLPPATWTPFPTLLPEAGWDILYDWFGGQDGCRLPCWGGITPGITTWDTAEQIIESVRGFADVDVFLNKSCNFGDCNEIRWSLIHPGKGVGYVYSKLPENKIHIVRTEIAEPSLVSALKLKNILNTYG